MSLDDELEALRIRELQLEESEEDEEVLADAHEVIEGLFLGSAEAAVEATTGPNRRQIVHILNVSGAIDASVLELACSCVASHSSETETQKETEANEWVHDDASRGKCRDDNESHTMDQEVGPAECGRFTRPVVSTRTWTQNGITTLLAPMDDYGRTALTEELLEKCFDFIRRGLSCGDNVLVHCALGVNRSVTIVAAFLMRDHGLSSASALDLVAEKRSCANPNRAYRSQLAAYGELCVCKCDT